MTKEWNFSALEPAIGFIEHTNTHSHTHSMNSPLTSVDESDCGESRGRHWKQDVSKLLSSPHHRRKHTQNGLSCDEIEEMRRCDSLEKKQNIIEH